MPVLFTAKINKKATGGIKNNLFVPFLSIKTYMAAQKKATPVSYLKVKRSI